MISKVILVRPRGFCAGVDRAIDVVRVALEIYGSPVYVKHAIVHNMHVVNGLKRQGVKFVETLSKIPKKSVVVFSAHGTTPKIIAKARALDHTVIDATCPLVTKVHLEAKRYANEGYYIIYIGHRGHPEPIGVFGEVPGDAIKLIEKSSEVKTLKVPQEEKLVCLTQTTLSVQDTKETIQALKKRFKKMIFPPASDICYATTNRQKAAKILAKKSSLVLVVGSKTSSNSQRLVEVCREAGKRAYLIDNEANIKKSWFLNVKVLGITSGASAPEYLIDGIIDFIKKQNRGVKVQNIAVINEGIKFPMPDGLSLVAKKRGKGLSYITKHKSASQI